MVTHVARNVLALIEPTVQITQPAGHIHPNLSLLQRLVLHTNLVLVTHDVRVSHMLSMDTAATLDHRQLLRRQILIRVGRKAATKRLLRVAGIIVATRRQIG